MDGIKVLSIDTESNGLDIRYDPDFRMLGLSYSNGRECEYLPVGHLGGGNLDIGTVVSKLQELIHDADAIVFHNAGYDIPCIKLGLGLDLWDSNWYCTMHMQHFLDENFPNKSLDYMAKMHLGKTKVHDERMESFIKGMGWGFIPAWLMEEYAKQDASLPLELFDVLYPDFVAQGFDGELWEYEKQFIHALVTMEQLGVSVDQEKSKSEITTGTKLMDQIVLDLGGLKPSSPKDLSTLLLERLELPVLKTSKLTGKPSFDKYAMEDYEEILAGRNDNTAQQILEYRGWQKAISTYFTSFIERVGKDGRLRTRFNTIGTRTSRLSCEKPNLQQIPRVSKRRWNRNTKQCIVPARGYRLWEIDYSNLELRLAAIYAEQENLIEAFNRGDNIWDYMIDVLGGGWDKQTAKTFTYMILYGAGTRKIALTMGKTLSEAAKQKKEYFGLFPRIQWASQTINNGAGSNGFVSLWTGRRRHFNGGESPHKAFNSVLQGGGAEVVKRALLEVWRECTDYNRNSLCRLVLTVHDSIVLEIKEGYEEAFTTRAAQIMRKIPTDFFGMNFEVDIHEWGQ